MQHDPQRGRIIERRPRPAQTLGKARRLRGERGKGSLHAEVAVQALWAFRAKLGP